MAESTEKQLKERLFTPKGEKVRQKIIDHIKEKNWERFLLRFPFVKEVENGRDLRAIEFGEIDLCRANFKRANLSFARFKGTDLERANFKRAALYKAYFEGANLERANFVRASDLYKTHFKGANLFGSNFKGAYIIKTYFRKVNLTLAILSNCFIEGVKFYDCTFDITEFDYSEIKDIDWGNSKINKRYFKNLQPPDYGLGFKDYTALMETYITLKNQFNKNGLYNDMSWAYLKEKESLRLHYKQYIIGEEKIYIHDRTKFFFKLLWEYILFFLFGYGEKPWHILGWSFLTIIIFGLIYKITNAIGSSLQDIDTGVTFWRSLYFSTITFTTVGFGDFHPLRDIPRIFVMTEAALGLFFYSLFVFTFGRRIAGR